MAAQDRLATKLVLITTAAAAFATASGCGRHAKKPAPSNAEFVLARGSMDSILDSAGIGLFGASGASLPISTADTDTRSRSENSRRFTGIAHSGSETSGLAAIELSVQGSPIFLVLQNSIDFTERNTGFSLENGGRYNDAPGNGSWGAPVRASFALVTGASAAGDGGWDGLFGAGAGGRFGGGGRFGSSEFDSGKNGLRAENAIGRTYPAGPSGAGEGGSTAPEPGLLVTGAAMGGTMLLSLGRGRRRAARSLNEPRQRA